MRRVEAIVVLAVIAGAFCTGLDRVQFHVDESHWIGLSAPFEAFFSGRFSDPIWQERPAKAITATVTYYVIGAARRIGGFPSERLNRPWRWLASEEANLAEGRMPEPRLLWWARAGVTSAAIVALFVFFRLLSRAAGRPSPRALPRRPTRITRSCRCWLSAPPSRCQCCSRPSIGLACTYSRCSSLVSRPLPGWRGSPDGFAGP